MTECDNDAAPNAAEATRDALTAKVKIAEEAHAACLAKGDVTGEAAFKLAAQFLRDDLDVAIRLVAYEVAKKRRDDDRSEFWEQFQALRDVLRDRGD